MLIYHREFGFPESLLVPYDTIMNLGFTNHAKERMTRDNYKIIVMPTVVKLTKENIVEMYTEDKKNVLKILMRVPYDYSRDIVLVIQPDFQKGKAKVITFWLNHKKDQHPGLDMTKYAKPDETPNA
jgi:hypothetical protein